MDPIFERPLRGVNWVWNRVLKASLISPWVSLHHPLGILLYIHTSYKSYIRPIAKSLKR